MKTWGHQDLIAATNADWVETLTLGVDGVPLVLEGATLEMNVRRRPGSVDPHLTLETGAGLTLVDPVARTATLEVDFLVMAQLGPGGYVYDVVATNGTTKTRVLEGAVNVTRGTTRP